MTGAIDLQHSVLQAPAADKVQQAHQQHPDMQQRYFSLRRLKESLQESEACGRRFLADLENARLILEETIRRAEETRAAFRSVSAPTGKPERQDGKDYGSVAAMIGAGLTEWEIAARSGLPEGEIHLISDLLRAKNERT